MIMEDHVLTNLRRELDMSEILETLAMLSVLVFVISSMLSMGLSLTTKQIVEPLKDTKLVVLALVANFVLVPAIAYAITILLSLESSISIGLILVSMAAGAPFLPKLVEVAKGNTPFSVGLMVLLMVVTIVYLPLVLPLVIESVEVNPLDIARSLIIMMLIPLGIGLFIKARYEDAAEKIRPTFASASNIAILALIVLGVVLKFESMIALVGSKGLLAALLFVAGALLAGYFLGGKDRSIKSVMALGTGQRNISAALVVAAQNFDSDVITFVLVFSIIGFIVLFPTAGELGKRSEG
ncbi:MAG: bile acid:sodium symporter [Anaerolineales bacterium]